MGHPVFERASYLRYAHTKTAGRGFIHCSGKAIHENYEIVYLGFLLQNLICKLLSYKEAQDRQNLQQFLLNSEHVFLFFALTLQIPRSFNSE